MKSDIFPLWAFLILCGLHLSYGCTGVSLFLPVSRNDSFVGEIQRVSTPSTVTNAVIEDAELMQYFKVEIVPDTVDTSITHVLLQTGDKFADILDIRRVTSNLSPLVTITCEGFGPKGVSSTVNMVDTNNRPPVFSGSLSSVLIQSTWDRTVPINWDSPIIVSDSDYEATNVKAVLSVSPDWLELEEIPLWDVNNPTNPRPATFDKSIRVRIKPTASLPIGTAVVTVTASDGETSSDVFSFDLVIEDASKGPRFSKTAYTAVLSEWPEEGSPIPVNVASDDGSILSFTLVDPPPYFQLDSTGDNLNVIGVVPDEAGSDTNNVVLLEVTFSLPDGSQFFSTIAVVLPQENVCTTVTPPETTECPTSTFNPATDCPTTTCNPDTDCPTTTPFDPVTDCPSSPTCKPETDCPTTTPFDPTTDCPTTTTCNPDTDCPTTTPFDPVTDCPTTTPSDSTTDCPTTCNPETDCSTTTPSDSTTDCPTFDPSTDCPTSTTELPPVTDCPTAPTTPECPTTCEPCPTTTSTSTECPTTFNPSTDCPTTTVDPNNPCPTCEPATCPTTPPNPTTTPCPVTCEPVTDCPTTTVDPNNPCPTCAPCLSTSPPPVDNCTGQPAASEDKGSNTGLIAGIGVVSAVGVVSIGAAVYFFLQAKKAVPSVDTSWSNPDKFSVERKPPRNSFSAPKALRASIPNIATDNGFANPAFNSGPPDSAGLEQVLSHSTPLAEDVSPYASASIIDSEPPTTATTNTTASSSAPIKSALATPREIDPDYETLPQPIEEKVVPDKPRGVRIADEVEIMNENEPDTDEDDNEQL